MATLKELTEEFSQLVETNNVNLDLEFKKISPPDLADQDSLVFCSTKPQLDEAQKSNASIICANTQFAEELSSANQSQNKTYSFSKNPYLLMAKCLEHFFPTVWGDFSETSISPTAQIHSTAQIGKNVRIGHNVVIQSNCIIDDHCIIRENSVIEKNSKIGEETHIFPFVYVGQESEIGNKCVIQSFTTIGSEGFGYAADENNLRHHILHKGKVVLEDFVEIGASCTIDRGTFSNTVLKTGCKLDNQIHIAHNCEIGEYSVLTGGFQMAGSTKIGKNFIGGARSGVLGHLNITDNVILSTCAVVMSDIKKSGVFGGFPALPIELHRKNFVAQKKIAEMRKNISALMKTVFKEK